MEFTKLNSDFIESLKKAGIELSDNVSAKVYSNMIIIYVNGENNKPLFASEVELLYSYRSEKIKISFGSSGSFDLSDTAPYWRTIHASNILKNWDIVSELVISYCKKYIDETDREFKK